MEKEKIEICGPLEEPLMENIVPEEINDLDSPSSSDTDNEKTDSPVPINAPIYRMFGRERSIHLVLGGGKRLVVARDMKGKRDRVVVVIGNMTITAGQVYEAMSNAGY